MISRVVTRTPLSWPISVRDSMRLMQLSALSIHPWRHRRVSRLSCSLRLSHRHREDVVTTKD